MLYIGVLETSVGEANCRWPRETANGSAHSIRRPSLIEKEIQELRAREEELRLSDSNDSINYCGPVFRQQINLPLI